MTAICYLLYVNAGWVRLGHTFGAAIIVYAPAVACATYMKL